MHKTIRKIFESIRVESRISLPKEQKTHISMLKPKVSSIQTQATTATVVRIPQATKPPDIVPVQKDS